MNKILLYIIISIFLIGNQSSFAQTDSVSTTGTIKIVKAKKQIYIKAFVSFEMYQNAASKPNASYGAFVKASTRLGQIPPDQIIMPQPIVEGYEEPFSYTKYYNSKAELKQLSLGDNEKDTIQLRIEIDKNGKYQYYHTTRKNTLTKSSNENTMVYSDAQIACMLRLKEIKQWKPAHQFIPYYTTKKKKKTVKFNKELLNADGVLTIILSTTPFSEE